MTYALTMKPTIANWLGPFPTNDQLATLRDRVRSWLVANGYVVGAGDVTMGPYGEIVVDVDRDPAAQWVAFDPAAPSTQEQADAALRVQIRNYLDTLQANVAALQQMNAQIDTRTATMATRSTLLRSNTTLNTTQLRAAMADGDDDTIALANGVKRNNDATVDLSQGMIRLITLLGNAGLLS